ncbi:MAG TPA: response regulator transcription factor [Actinophytocola sp.]|uniref:response regulator transcription factor n=1 Tax=Actinophytocola sp. TaxID=1872138 RepID=UPI002E04C09C|nr:response regulator transcription factor [Actinophytocola sp.]
MKVLLVDDDEQFAAALAKALRRSGHQVVVAHTAAAALSAGPADLVLLDLGLPDRDGLAICETLRRRGGPGIIVLSGRTGEADRVAGLRCGADDYLCKPFVFGELAARIEAVLRRVRPRPAGARLVGELHLDLDRHEVRAGGRLIHLNRKEFQILRLLSDRPGVVLSRQQLVAEVWQTHYLSSFHTLDVHIARLRAKLGGSAVVQAVRGVGYRLTAPERSGPMIDMAGRTP